MITMTLLSNFFLFQMLTLELFAYLPPLKNFKDGSKSAFIQAPYINTVRDQKVKEIQEEITYNWPEGIITYYVDDKSYDPSIGDRLRAAMSVLESAACIRFRAVNGKPNGNSTWLNISNPKKKRECDHDPEVLDNGEVLVILGYDCLNPRDLLHSLLHGIGFKDEVTHPHRDKYIKVVWDNVQPAYRHLYRTQPVEISRSIVEYDPLSIMHFHDRAFSINGKPTLVPLLSGLMVSPSESLSQLDKMRLQIYFGHECNKRKFSSLMETCKKSLKGEVSPDNGDSHNIVDSIESDHANNKNKTIDHIDNDQEEGHNTGKEDANQHTNEDKKGQNTIEDNASEDTKTNPEEKQNAEEDVAQDGSNEDKGSIQNTKEILKGDENSSITSLKGPVMSEDISAADKNGFVGTSAGDDYRKESGINLNYESNTNQ